MQAVQVVVEVSYVKNPRFFVVESVELADTSKLQKTPNDSAGLSRKTVSFMGWKSYFVIQRPMQITFWHLQRIQDFRWSRFLGRRWKTSAEVRVQSDQYNIYSTATVVAKWSHSLIYKSCEYKSKVIYFLLNAVFWMLNDRKADQAKRPNQNN